jgi:uncharacterized SAM-binding protein YcdF (DUF218 family)
MDDLFFYLARYVWTVVSPDSLFIILLSLCLLLLLFGQTKKATVLLSLLTVTTLFISFFSVGDWLLYPLESRYKTNPELPEKIDGIIVLGGSVIPDRSAEWQQLETNLYHERLSSFIDLAKRYPDARLVFSGGNSDTDKEKPTEAQIAEKHFLASGIEQDRLFMENKARNTYENAIYIKQLMAPKPDETWLMITTAYHMPRSVGVFCQQNWKVIPYPVDHQTLPSKLYQPGFSLIGHAYNLVLAAHEWLGLLAYYVSGKTNDIFPSECDSHAL